MDPTPSEMSEARTWAQAAFDGSLRAPEYSFSFVYGGRPSSELLGSWGRETETRAVGAHRLEHGVELTDPTTGLRVRCDATEFGDFPAVEWVLRFENTGTENTPILEDVQALDMVATGDGDERCVLHYSLGDDVSDRGFAPQTRELPRGRPTGFAPDAGRSSEGYLPFFNVQRGTGGLVCAVGWTGQWAASFAPDESGPLHIRAGIETTHLTLHPGESIRTPRILLVFWEGDEWLRGNQLFRQLLLSHYVPRQDGELVWAPICGSVFHADPDGNYERPHLRTIPTLGERGMEVFWSDFNPTHWYVRDFPHGTGNWEPDLAKYPRGLKPIGDAVKAAGMEFLLWFEPERAMPGTRPDREHPEWLLKSAGELGHLFNLGIPEARKWMTDYIDAQVTEAQLGWIRWDFNMPALGFWQRTDAPDRQGISEAHHIEGLYAMWDDLMSRHPGLVIDNCGGGGRRIDLETLSRSVPLWHSDMQAFGHPFPTADQAQNAGLFHWVPQHGCGNYGLEPSYAFRSAMTTGNILCREGDSPDSADPSSPEAAEAVARTVDMYHRVRPYMLGDFYPLFAHRASEDVWHGYQFHRRDLDAGMALVFRRAESPYSLAEVALRGVDGSKRYTVRSEDDGEVRVLTGKELSSLSVGVPAAPGSSLLFYERAE